MTKSDLKPQGSDGAPISNPIFSPLYPAPPMEYRDCWTTMVTFRTTPEMLRKFVPDPLVPNPDGILMAMCDDIFATGFGRYREFALLAPVTFKGKSYTYLGYVMVDNDIAFAAGREIWGAPKKMGRIGIDLKDGILTGTLERGGIELARLSVSLDALGDPSVLGGSTGEYLHYKLIPSVDREAPPEVQQITVVEVGLKYHRLVTGRATLEFRQSAGDAFGSIPVLETLGGMYINGDRTVPYGRVLYDYLK